MKVFSLFLLMLSFSQFAFANWPEDSIFHLNSQWKTEKNETKKICEFNENGYFVALIFTSCKGVCPLLVSDLKYMASKLKPEDQKNARFLLISIDPATDTPKVLAEYKKKMRLDDRWTLLQGKQSDVNEIAAALEFQFKESKIEKFTHSSTVYLINKKGQVLAKQVQRMKNMDNFLSKASQVFKGKP